MKFAVICSAGGGAFFAAYDMLAKTNRYCKNDFIVITDRACGAEQESILRGIEFHRIPFETKDKFSIEVAQLLLKKGVGMAFMLYSRLVTADLFLALPTLNIHPALLPAFKGINAIGQAINSGVKFIGATLHVTTEKMDDGVIVAQVVSPIGPELDSDRLNKMSFLQKTYLMLTVFDCIEKSFLRIDFDKGVTDVSWFIEAEYSCSANPCIQSDDLKELFQNHQMHLGIGSIIQ